MKVNNLAQRLGIDTLALPQKEKEEVLSKVQERLNTVILGVVIANISDEEAGQISQVLKEHGDIENVVAGITSRIPNLMVKMEKAIDAEMVRLKVLLGTGSA